MIQSEETSEQVITLFKEYGLQIRSAPLETPLSQELLNNTTFLKEFSQIRGMEDYVQMIAKHGHLYCLTVKQSADLAKILGMSLTRRNLAVRVTKEISESLEKLFAKANEPPKKSLRLGNDFLKYTKNLQSSHYKK